LNDAALARFRRVAVEAFDLALALPDLPTRLRELADWVDTMPSCLRSGVTKAPEVGSGSAKREVESDVERFSREAAELAEALEPSLHLSPPRIAVEKEEAFTEDELRAAQNQPGSNRAGDMRGMVGGRKARDLTGHRVGTFVGIERVGSDNNGSPLWFFRCELCGESKTWSAGRVANMSKGPPGKRHECPGTPKSAAPSVPEDVGSGPVALTADEAELVRTGVPVKMLSDGTIEATPSVPLATDAERAAPPRNPRLSGFTTLVGQRFGTWKVVERAGGALGMTYWKCACTKCGARKEIAALGAHGLRSRPPPCPSCRLRGGKSEAPDEGEEAAQ
jgi:hypothetical protein